VSVARDWRQERCLLTRLGVVRFYQPKTVILLEERVFS
jgi:hypothetical protein